MSILTESDYNAALNRVCYELWDAPEGTPESRDLDALTDEIVAYEEIHYPMPKPKKLSDFRPQTENANAHTEHGMRLLNQAMERGGWITAITTAADGEVIDGSARWEQAVDRFGEDIEPIVVEHDGTRPVVCVRVDIESADEAKAKELSVAANKVAERNLSWNVPILDAMEDVPMPDWFLPSEIEAWAQLPEIPDPGPLDFGGGKREIQCVCPACGHEFVKV